MIRLSVGYPSHDSSVDILKSDNPFNKIQAVIDTDRFTAIQETVAGLHVDDAVYDFIVNLAEASRNNEYIGLGISPRGTKVLLRMSKAYAYMNGKDYVGMDDVVANLVPVLSHRIVLNSKAKAKDVDVLSLLRTLQNEVKVAKITF
jgi:MoxR-like ATPase